jgi:SSS family solute:Na+ symporter
MAQNFYTAIWAFSICFVVTIAISLMTAPRPDAELVGLVRSLTKMPEDEKLPWFRRPAALALVVIVILVTLNVIFY